MIKLIKNELIKIFHKKSIYIILAICLAFVILTNYIYKNVNTFYSTADNKEYINSLIEEQKTIDLSNSDNIDWYVSNQTEIDMYNLKEHYGTDSWQSALIVDRLYETIYQINYLTYGKYKNSTELKKLQKEYNDIITKFDSDDWRSFVEDEITELNKTLKEENKVLDKAKGTTAISEAERNVFVTELDIEIANLRLDQNISYGTDYLNTAINSYKYAKTDWYDTKDIERDYDAEVSYQETLKTIAMAKYSIDNKYNSYEEESNMKSIYESFLDEYQFFIIIIIVFVCGAIVSEEFNKGTIKLLLIRPYKRKEILLSKFITCLIMVLFAYLAMFVLQSIVGYIMFGGASLSIPVVNYDYSSGQIITQNIFEYMGITYLAKLPIFVLLATLAFTLSTLFNSSAIAITISAIGSIASSVINALVINFDVKFMKYFVTLNWDFTDYLFGGSSSFKYTNLKFSVIICIVYFLVMVITSFIVFKHKNIKNI